MNDIMEKRKNIADAVVRSVLICLLVLLTIFAFTNHQSLSNILKNNPERTYTFEEIELIRWTPLETEGVFCSEEDPIISFDGYTGYIQSIELYVTPLDETPECSPVLYWTDESNPVFTQDCSQNLTTKKIENGYSVSVNRHVTDFRLDLYSGAGAKVQIDRFVVNPRTLVFPTELILPVLIIGLLYVYYVVSLAHSKMDQLKTATAVRGEKIEELDFVRTVCAVGIILFHVACYTSSDSPKFFYTYANGGYGTLLVGVFFVISGGVLQHNYQRIGNLFAFYYKRWKSIFPMFYTTFLFFFIRNVVTANTLFYGGSKWRILLSVVGLDGYFNYKFPGYYIVGEWFLGAIVLLYVLYPAFLKVVNVMGWKVMLFAVPLTLWQFRTSWFEISATSNLIYCSVMFISGMLIFKYKLYTNNILKAISCCISLVVLFVPIPRFTLFMAMVSYVLMFFALFAVAEFVIKAPPLKNIFTCVGGLSFPMFLVQNKVIGFLTMYIVVHTDAGLFGLEVLAVCLCMLYAWCIRAVAQAVLRTKWFSSVEKSVLFLINKGE